MVEIKEQYNKLNQVHRVILLLVGALLIGGGWYAGLSHYYVGKHAHLIGLQKEVSDKRAALKRIDQGQGADHKDLYFLYAQHIISAKQTVGVLKQIFRVVPGVRLLSMENLPSQPVGIIDLKKRKLDQHHLGFLKGTAVQAHDIKMRLEGNFFAIEAYLKAVEQTKLPLLWYAMDYQVVRYPLAHVTLKLRTLSKGKDWLRV
jgi:MSHA biogenesis protein MshJ